MASSEQLFDRITTTFSKVTQMESDLNNIHQHNTHIPWQTELKHKLFNIKTNIQSLDTHSKKLQQKQLSLKQQIKSLNHQINELENTGKNTNKSTIITTTKSKKK
eukprot:902200_1